MKKKGLLRILMADDDPDDRDYFYQTLLRISDNHTFSTVDDGEQLLTCLTEKDAILPDLLFLDINMPRKNGYECLCEIRAHRHLKDLPVVIYSTSAAGPMTDLLYSKGANYYLRKGELKTFEKDLLKILHMTRENTIKRPLRSHFFINDVSAS
jgi:CheY-like chemotaxis protein